MAERTAPRASRAPSKTTPGSKKANGKAPSRRSKPTPTTNQRGSVPEHHARIVAVANQKGGVGKSTTAVSLGAALAEQGKRVLVVDLDPQGNASTGLGIRHEAREVTVYDVLAAEAAIDGAIVATPVENLFAIPSTIDLAGAEIELVSQFSRELRLRKALEPLKDGAFDFVLLDCPPSLGLLTVNALAAAEELIVPIQCEYYALEGLGQLLRNVRLVQQNVNPGLRLTGIVMTMYDPRTKLSEQVVEEVRRYFGERVYDTIIPRTVRLSEAPGFGQPITVYDPRSRGAECYRDLAREVAEKLPADVPLPVMDDLPTVVVPPPEPVAARAPRPLVPEEELDVDEDVTAMASEPEPDVPSAAQDDVEVEGAVDIGVPVSEDVTRTRGDDAAEPEPPPEVEGPHASTTEGEPLETHVEAEVDSGAAPPVAARREPTVVEGEPVVENEPAPTPSPAAGPYISVPDPQPAPPAHSGDVVVSDDDEQPPADEPEDVRETQSQRKRRWSLFRRGENR